MSIDDRIREIPTTLERGYQSRKVQLPDDSRFRETIRAYDPFNFTTGTGFKNRNTFISTIWKDTTPNPTFSIELVPTQKTTFEIIAIDNGTTEMRDMDSRDAPTWFYEKEIRKFIVKGKEEDFDTNNQIKFFTVNSDVYAELDELGEYQGEVYIQHKFDRLKKEGEYSYGILYLKKIIPYTTSTESSASIGGDNNEGYISYKFFGEQKQPTNVSYLEMEVAGPFGLNNWEILDGENNKVLLNQIINEEYNEKLEFQLFWPNVNNSANTARINLPWVSEFEYLKEVANKSSITQSGGGSSIVIETSDDGEFYFLPFDFLPDLERTAYLIGGMRDIKYTSYTAGAIRLLFEQPGNEDIKQLAIKTMEYLLPKELSLFGSGVGQGITGSGELPRLYNEDNPYWTANSTAIYVLDNSWRYSEVPIVSYRLYAWSLSEAVLNDIKLFNNNQGSSPIKQDYYYDSELERLHRLRLLNGQASYLGTTWGVFGNNITSTNVSSGYVPNTIDINVGKDFLVLTDSETTDLIQKSNQSTPWVQTTRTLDIGVPQRKSEYKQTNESGGRGYGLEDIYFRRRYEGSETKKYLFRLQLSENQTQPITIPFINQYTLKIWGGYEIKLTWRDENLEIIKDDEGDEIRPVVYKAPNRTSNPLQTVISEVYGIGGLDDKSYTTAQKEWLLRKARKIIKK